MATTNIWRDLKPLLRRFPTRRTAYSGEPILNPRSRVKKQHRRALRFAWLADRRGETWACKHRQAIQEYLSDLPATKLSNLKLILGALYGK